MHEMIEEKKEEIGANGTKKYEEDLTGYIHLKIEERTEPESKIEQAIVPGAVREKSFWRRLHTHRKILVSRTSAFFKDTKKMIVVWTILIAFGVMTLYFGWDREIAGGALVIFGIMSSAFAWLGAVLLSGVGVIPLIGPSLVTILSSSLLWAINALGYFVSVIAIKAGHGKTILNYRLLVIVFLTGLVAGYVIARLVQ